jgi:hypothetical protein
MEIENFWDLPMEEKNKYMKPFICPKCGEYFWEILTIIKECTVAIYTNEKNKWVTPPETVISNAKDKTYHCPDCDHQENSLDNFINKDYTEDNHHAWENKFMKRCLDNPWFKCPKCGTDRPFVKQIYKDCTIERLYDSNERACLYPKVLSHGISHFKCSKDDCDFETRYIKDFELS